MRPTRSPLRKALIGVAVLTMIVATYWTGYSSGFRAGLSDQGPQRRALVVVRRTKGNPNSSGFHYLWFDIRDPRDAKRFAIEEERLRASGAEFYVTKGLLETTVRPEPTLRHVNSHR